MKVNRLVVHHTARITGRFHYGQEGSVVTLCGQRMDQGRQRWVQGHENGTRLYCGICWKRAPIVRDGVCRLCGFGGGPFKVIYWGRPAKRVAVHLGCYMDMDA